MGRTDRKQRPAGPGIDLTGRRRAPAGAIATLIGCALAALWALALLTQPGRIGYGYAFFFLEFFGGVFTLIGLTGTVMLGLLATDRLVLQPHQRVWIQSAHRTLGIVSVSCLAIHILTKISEGRTTVTGTVIPFLGGTAPGQSILYVGLGPMAGYLMVAVLWTGLVRRRFAGVGRPWIWRALHCVAYLSWPVALLHGLGAGRPPAAWVTLSYLACVVAVAAALLLRLSMDNAGRRAQRGRLATTTMSTGTVSIRPVGKLAPAPARTATYRADEPATYRAEEPATYRAEEPATYRAEEPAPYRRRTERPAAHRAEEPATRDDTVPARYRASAPAPPYIPAPPPADHLITALDDLSPLPDDTPTLVDLASRRAIRDAARDRDAARERDAARVAAARSRRARRRKTADRDEVDEDYWGYLRGEAR